MPMVSGCPPWVVTPPISGLGQKQICAVHSPMSALGQKRTSGREVRHATFDDVGLVSSQAERTEAGRRAPMAKLVDDGYSTGINTAPTISCKKATVFSQGPHSSRLS